MVRCRFRGDIGRRSVAVPGMSLLQRLTGVLVLLVAGLGLPSAHRAAIDCPSAGCPYDATCSNIAFRVYSSKATRIEVAIYKTPKSAQEVLRYVMTKNASWVWSKPCPRTRCAPVTG